MNENNAENELEENDNNENIDLKDICQQVNNRRVRLKV